MRFIDGNTEALFKQFQRENGLTDDEMRNLAGFMRNPSTMSLNQEIVGVREFVLSPHYMNAANFVYPVVLDELEKINETEGPFAVVCATGGIGSAKTTVGVYTQIYQTYRLSCYDNPHELFGLDPASEIVIIFQSISGGLSKGVNFDRFKAMIDRAPYFQYFFPYDKDLKSELRFPKRVVVKPISGTDTAALGQNVIGGCIDEINSMQIIENSKKALDGGTYNQAIALYDVIARRRESRFKVGADFPGMLVVSGSRRYPGQFTDKLEEEAKTNPLIYVYDKRVWDIKPEFDNNGERYYSGEFFRVFTGDATRKPRIMGAEEIPNVTERHLVMEIPVEFRRAFVANIYDALRDIAGVSTLAIHPFMPDTNAVAAAFGTVESVFSQEVVDFAGKGLAIYPNRIQFPAEPRWVHIDLALTGDSAGVAIGWCKGFTKVVRMDGDAPETLPRIVFDGVLEVRPPPNGEINFAKIRSILYRLRDEMGMNIQWVSYDSFQSSDSIQILGNKGFMAGRMSMDVKTLPYDVSKTAIQDGRVQAPTHDVAAYEWVRLERNNKTLKIDHPPDGSKDCADAMAGVIFGLSTRRDVWVRHGIPLGEIPPHLTGAKFQEPPKEGDPL